METVLKSIQRNLFTQCLFLDEPRTYSSTSNKSNLKTERSTSTLRIACPDQSLDIGLKGIDIRQALSDTLSDLGSGITIAKYSCKTIAESLVGESGRHGNTKHGAQATEEVRAGGGNRLIIARGIRN